MPSGRDQLIHVEANLALGTLAADATASVAIIAGTEENGFLIKKLKLAVQYRSKTAGEGPLSFGLAQQLSNVQIAEAIVARPTADDAVPLGEEANRKVFPMGVISRDGVVSDIGLPTMIEEVRGFPFREIDEGQALDFYVHNHGAQLTTGAIVEAYGVMFGSWLRD